MARRRLLLVACAIWLVFIAFASQGSRPLWEPDEGRYTAVALEMNEHGDYLIPRLNDHQEHFTKPPLTYWTVAVSLKIFGHSAWAARLPSALAFIATGLLLFALGARFVPRHPWLPVLLWSTSLVSVLGANVANTDTLLVLWETLAVLGYLRYAAAAPTQRTPALATMWLGFALAFLTKGPPALLPLLAIVAYVGSSGGWRAIRGLFTLGTSLLFLAVGGTWFIGLTLERPELIDYFLGFELVDRIFSAVHDRNSQWYGALKIYVPVLFLATLPWCLLDRRWITTLGNVWRRPFWRSLLAHDPDRAFLLLWLLLPLAVFFLARSRMYLYVLPLLLPIALLLARALSAGLASFSGRSLGWLLLAWPIAVLLIKDGVAKWPTNKDSQATAQAIQTLVAGQAIAELYFVGSVPSYGQRLYLGADVEQISTTESAQWRQGRIRVAPLCEALARPRGLSNTGLSLALVSDRAWSSWSTALPTCLSQRPPHLGRVGALNLVDLAAYRPAPALAYASPATTARAMLIGWISTLRASWAGQKG